MSRGGARNRSGPHPREDSGRSERRGYKLTALPAEGYDGPAPAWPLPEQSDREAELWEWAWSTPQACAWSMPSERWRSQIVARWVRQAVRCEGEGASAADHGQLHRYADQIGLTTAGLREMGWKVSVDEVAAERVERREPPAEQPKRARRLQAVGDAQ